MCRLILQFGLLAALAATANAGAAPGGDLTSQTNAAEERGSGVSEERGTRVLEEIGTGTAEAGRPEKRPRGAGEANPERKSVEVALTTASEGPRAPLFELSDQAGKPVALRNYLDRVVVLEWVNPDCPFVQRHYREGTMKLRAERYAARGVAWLAINSTGTAGVEKNLRFHEAQKLAYPVLDDSFGVVGRMYGAKTTPHMFLIDRGRIVYSGAIDDDPTGAKSADERVNYLDAAVEEVLAGKAVGTPRTKPYGCPVKFGKLGIGGAVGDVAPDFTLQAHDGRPVTMSDYADRIVVLEWVNPDCPAVQRHHGKGTMRELASKWAERGVAWLGVNPTRGWTVERNRQFAQSHKLPYPVLDDSAASTARDYGARTTPQMMIVNHGIVAYNGAIDSDPDGQRPKEAVTNYVDKALTELTAGKAVTTARTKPYGCAVEAAGK